MSRLPLKLEFDGPSDNGDTLDLILETVRTHFEMQVAYVSEIVDGNSIFRAVSAPGLEALAFPGAVYSLQEVYCQHILDGRLPSVMADTAAHPLAVSMPITTNVPIGSHLSVPVYRDDGSVFGMFCCLRSTPHPTLGERDLKIMETFANLASRQINAGLRRRSEAAAAARRIDSALEGDALRIVLQPIVSLETGAPIKFEALSRFAGDPYRPPNLWYEEASAIGRQVDLEALSIVKALSLFDRLPPDVTIGVNASPETIATGVLADIIRTKDPARVVVEVTEHDIVEDHERLGLELDRLRSLGVRTAVDDVGAGFSGLLALLRMRPDILKLDIGLIRDIDTNPAKQALVAGMVHFAEQTGATTIAEGVETEAERATLRQLRVQHGQGYLFAKPMEVEDAKAWLAARCG
ncbi:sensor domain-containing phosphodiesterase [Martelella radicis]|uniref:EAL domain-containing protein (Putative c-di-GMP-specific phosphodiesterase class I) n=1 Tax=Martelella radicis TaxID=1397476 RepID=A0A7W6KIJ8_9HYPH|nr:EAL domain-containing protein [Martelella radicis]MBB4121968.1 EAL domain-containing protein (putative c-di-GMP-specific phosphodiesterase class I) [Martelella radicis]